ncbi:MAG: GtrA family protein [Sphingomonadales bacterium]|nr:GtrA family protein [Sphingomonadales bacterium]
MNRRELLRFGLFLAAGAVNTLFGFAVFAALIALGTGNDLAVVLSTVAGVLFNFQTYGKVFSAQGFSRLPHFVGTYAAILAANILTLRALTAAGCNAYLGQALVVTVIAPLSFLVMRRWVFAFSAPGAGEVCKS